MKRGEQGYLSWSPSPERAKQQLRAGLALFLLALLVPLGVLFMRVYEQLENEVILQNRTAAEQLVSQVDARLRGALGPEDARSFDEYNFYKVDQLPLQQSKGLIFSPLSEFPPKTGIPGLVGYFQVNPDGTLQSPTLPKLETGMPVPEIKEDELALRVAAWDRLSQLLAGEILSARPEDAKPKDKSLDELASVSADSPAELAGFKADTAPPLQVPPEKLLQDSPFLDRAQKVTDLNLDAQYLSRNESKKEAAVLAKGSKTGAFGPVRYAEKQEAVRAKRKERVDLAVAAGSFEEVTRGRGVAEEEAPPRTPPAAPISESDLTVSSAVGAAATADVRIRKPNQAGEGGSAETELRRNAVQVLTLEGEVEPFQFKVLDELHFLFLRKVWRDGRRYLQGFVVEGEPLIEEYVAAPFQESSIAANGNLIVGYRGIYFRRVSGSESVKIKRRLEQEIVLHRAMLTPPFDKVELLFTAPSLPPAPGAMLVNTLAYAIAFVILAGLYGLYRIGLRQILFAKERSDFVSAVSHELKTPLTSIRMYSEMLRSGWVDDEAKKRSYYDYIFRESERLSRLIANVLQFARLSNSASPLELKREPAARLLELAVEKVRSQVESAGFELVTEFEDRRLLKEREAEVEIEEDAFLRIAINLVDNALKFSAKAERKQIVLSVRAAEREVIFSARDFGPGVAKDQMKKIFQLFYRAEDEMNRNTPGTGIGLALVSELAGKMNATVDLRNCDPGAEFLLKLPLV